jgi:hypothetical protein
MGFLGHEWKLLNKIYSSPKLPSREKYSSEITPIFDANLKICIDRVAFSGIIENQEDRKKSRPPIRK